LLQDIKYGSLNLRWAHYENEFYLAYKLASVIKMIKL